jgi:hypothetical protein
LNEIRKGYLRVKRNPVSINMPIRNVKISSSKDTIISFNKIYIKRSVDVTLTTTEGEYAETTTECTTAAHDATTEASAHKKRRKKRSAVVETETSASDHTSDSCSAEATTICIPNQVIAEESAAHRRRRRRRSAEGATTTHSSGHDVECVTIPTPDKVFKDFSIIMLVILSCLFTVLFVLYYFCTKDLVLEAFDKAKLLKQ